MLEDSILKETSIARKVSNDPTLLAIQASPRRNGFTNQLMEIILEGARSMRDVRIDEIFLPDQKFEFCRGCFSCKNPPHACILDDYMGNKGKGELYRKLVSANAFILTLPTYLWSPNALAHNFFERCYPFLWSQQLNGMPYVYVTSAYNSGMHRESARNVEKWGFIFNLQLVGGLSVHFSYFEEIEDEVRELGRRSAISALKDFQEGRKKITNEEKYVQALDGLWDLPGLYVDNITGGTGRREDILTTRGFERGWFKQPEAYLSLREVDTLFHEVIENLNSGNRKKAMRLLSKAHYLWKEGTRFEFLSRK
jgi:multimeric flavodoxin WrbA